MLGWPSQVVAKRTQAASAAAQQECVSAVKGQHLVSFVRTKGGVCWCRPQPASVATTSAGARQCEHLAMRVRDTVF